MTDLAPGFPPISLPPIGLYADLETLFNSTDVAACQQALQQVAGIYREMGVVPLDHSPTVLYFPNRRILNHFLDDMQKHGCRSRKDVAFSGYGRRATITQEVSAEGEATDANGRNLFIAFQLIPAPEQDSILFENMLPPRLQNLPGQITQMVYRQVQRLAVRGVPAEDSPANAPLSGFYVALAALDFGTETALTKRNRGDSFFTVFDKMFDAIDKLFAGGSGADFATMAQSANPAVRELLYRAIDDAFANGLRDNIAILTPDVIVNIRARLPERAELESAFVAAGGVLVDDVHDGTFYTLTGRIAARAFHDDDGDNGLASALQRLKATVISVSRDE